MAQRDLSDNAQQAARCEQLDQNHASSLAASCWAELAQHAAARSKAAGASHGERAAHSAQPHTLKSDLAHLGHDAGRLTEDPRARHAAEGALTFVNPFAGMAAAAADRKLSERTQESGTARNNEHPSTQHPADSSTTGQKSSQLGHDAANVGRDLKNNMPESVNENAKRVADGAKKLFGHLHTRF